MCKSTDYVKMTDKREYTKEQINFIVDLVQNKGESATSATRLMCETFNVTYDESRARHIRKILQTSGVTNNVKTIEDTEEFKKAQLREHDSEKKRFIISSAQSDTQVHKDFLTNMEAYADFVDGELLIVANRYKNPTSLESSKRLKGTEVWVSEVQPYLTANYHKLHKYIHLAGNLKVSPTASTPLTGLNGVSGKASMIIGSPRVHLKSLPVLDNDPNKLLLSTGMCTLPNYTDTKSGFKGAYHHTFGFVIVECDGDDFHVRQVTATEDGSFYDLIYYTSNGTVVEDISSKEAVILGDIHTGETDMEVFQVSKRMLEMFNPKQTFVHDLFSGYSINRHEKNNPIVLMQKEKEGKLDLSKEIEEVFDFVEKYLLDHNPVIVKSNHDVFLDTMIIDSDWRKESNKATYLYLANLLAMGKAPKGLLPALLEERFGDQIRCLSINESVKVKGWECGQHGHKNSNGSRPSPTSFKNMNTKICSGHSHVLHREDGYACVGTNTHKRLGYNESWSSWTHGNGVIHPDGKLQLINIVNNKFTTLF